MLFAKLENLEKNVAKQNDKIDRMSNRLYSGLQGPRTRSEWVKDLKDKNMLTQDNAFFKAFDVSVESSPELLRLLNGEKIANFDF